MTLLSDESLASSLVLFKGTTNTMRHRMRVGTNRSPHGSFEESGRSDHCRQHQLSSRGYEMDEYLQEQQQRQELERDKEYQEWLSRLAQEARNE